MCPFEVVVERRPGDEFVNVFNRILANLVGSNTNIQIGDFAHVYYSTLYTSKTTQKEDTASFLAVSSALDKRINKALKEGMVSGEPDFVEGLSRVLSGIRAHLSSNVMSATMGHLLVTQGSRFTYSHSFSNLLLTQLGDLLDNKDIRCRLKKKTDKDGVVTWWPDCFAHDYKWRPSELEEVCSYEMMMKHDKCYTRKEGKLDFIEGHPGRSCAFLVRSKTVKIPIISMADALPDLADLELHESAPSSVALFRRNEYAKRALMLFLPFRSKDELLSEKDGTHWSRFTEACEDGTIWRKGLDILQNIQNRATSSTMRRAPDHVEVLTNCKESSGQGPKSGMEFDFDVSEVESHFEEIFQSSQQASNLYDSSRERQRSHKVLRGRSGIQDQDLVKPPLIAESIFSDACQSNNTSEGNDEEMSGVRISVNYGSIIEFVEAALIQSDSDNESVDIDCDSASSDHAETGESSAVTMSDVAKSFKLDQDWKQEATYEVICATFLLELVQEHGASFHSSSAVNSAIGANVSDKEASVVRKLRRCTCRR